MFTKQLSKMKIALVVMSLLAGIVAFGATPQLAFAGPDNDEPDQTTREEEEDAPPEPFAVHTVDAEKVLNGFVPENQRKSKFGTSSPFGDDVRVGTVTTLRGLKESGLPDWAQREELMHLGYFAWDEVPDSKLDEQIAPVQINLDYVELIDEKITSQGPSESTEVPDPSKKAEGNAQPRFIGTLLVVVLIGAAAKEVVEQGCTDDWETSTPSVKKNNYELDKLLKHDVEADFVPDELDLKVDADIGLTLDIEAKGTVRYKRFNELCAIAAGALTGNPVGIIAGLAGSQVPYKWQVVESSGSTRVSIDGKATLGGTGTVTETAFLYRQMLGSFRTHTPSTTLWGPVELSLDLTPSIEFGIKYQTQVSVNASKGFEQTWEMNGFYLVSWNCSGVSDCKQVHKEAEFDVDNATNSPLLSQTSVDIQLVPYLKFDLAYDLDVNVGKVKDYDLAKGNTGIVVQLPARYHITSGNNCSDADGDGNTETVKTQFVDLNLEIFFYLEGSIFDDGYGDFMPFNIPFVANDKPVYPFEFKKDLYQKNIYFAELFRDEATEGGYSSAFDPVVTFSSGPAKPGITISNRSCYPFTSRPEYQIDWGSGRPLQSSFPGFITAPDGVDQEQVRVRLHRDEAGRQFEPGGWVTVDTQARLLKPPTNVKASVASPTSGEISWDPSASPNIVGYEVTRRVAGEIKGTKLGTIKDTTLLDSELTKGRTYKYSIVAVDVDGNKSKAASISLEVPPGKVTDGVGEPIDIGVPTAPPELTASRYSSSAGEIQWKASSDRDGQVVSYEVVRNGEVVQTKDAKSFYQSDLSEGTYSYEVYAIDNDGKRSPASKVELTV